jgi:hypothetical protein
MLRTSTSLVAFLLVVGCANHPPGAPGVAIAPADPRTADDLVASIPSEAMDEDDDPVTYSYTWFQDGAERTDLGSTSTVVSANTAKGQVWRLVVTPNDGEEDGPTAEATVTVINTAPVAEVSISPSEPDATEDLIAIPDATDDDDDEVTYSYRWLLGGEATSYTDATLPAEATTKGDQWTVEVTPDDGDDEGELVTAVVNIENSLPLMTSLSIAPDPAAEADTITATVEAEDADGDEVTFTYAWSVDGVVVQDGGDATLTGSLFDKHQEVFVTVTPNDGWVDGQPLDSNAITISNTAPSISGVSLDPTTIYEASTVSCVSSGWADDDGDAEGYGYAWTVNGADVGVTTGTLDGTSFAKGDEIVCTVTPNDGEEDGAAVSSTGSTVLNTAPVITAASLSSTSPDTDDTLSVAITASDDDGDTVAYQYAWYVDGTMTVATATISGTLFSKGQTVWVEVTPQDGTESGATVTSDIATVVNTPPTVSSVYLTPSAAYTDDTLTASTVTTDADGDTVSLAYAWYVDGTLQATTGSSLDGSTYFDKDAGVYVVVTPNDGDVDGSTLTSSTITILNMPPTAPTISISPEDPTEDDDLVCIVDVDSTDADGDSVSYSIEWMVDGTVYTGATTTMETGDTVSSAATGSGEDWTCTLTPNDGEDAGESGTASATIRSEFEGWSSGTVALTDASITFYGEAAGDGAGNYLSSTGDVDGDGLADMLIAARGNDQGGTSAGKVYLVLASSLGSSSPISLAAANYGFVGTAAGDILSCSGPGPGDVDGDGLADLLMASRDNDDAGTDYGKVYVFLARNLGSPGTLDVDSADYTFVGEAGGTLGEQGWAGAGDVNGDGLDDLLVSAVHADDGGSSAGKVYLLRADSIAAASGGSLGTADLAFIGENAADYAGVGASGAGDIDGDGLGDIVISAIGSDAGGSDSGAVYVVLADGLGGTGDISLSTADHTVIGESAGDGLGYNVAGLHDFDGDGLADIAFGSSGNDSGGSDAGKAYVVLGATLSSTATLDASAADYAFVGSSAGDAAGCILTSAEDVDADGLTDLLFTAHKADYHGSDSGKAYLVLSGNLAGPGTSSASSADYVFMGDGRSDYAGSGAAGLGDVNGDGLDDLLIGAHGDDSNGTDAGSVFLLLTP